MRLIFRPDKLTQIYVAGDRKKYINPIRLFLIMLVFLIAAFLLSLGNFGTRNYIPKFYKDFYQSTIFEKFDNKVSSYQDNDSTRLILEGLKDDIFSHQKCPDIDTLFGGVTLMGSSVKILKRDYVELSIDEIFEKYDVEGYWDKLLLRQSVKINRNPNFALKYLASNGAWGIVPSILLICFLLLLLHRSNLVGYLEHLVLVCNIHSTLFLFGILFCLSTFILPHEFRNPVIFLTLIISLLLVLLVFKNYYRQNWLKTVAKFGLVSIAYFMLSLFFIMLTMVISGFIYK